MRRAFFTLLAAGLAVLPAEAGHHRDRSHTRSDPAFLQGVTPSTAALAGSTGVTFTVSGALTAGYSSPTSFGPDGTNEYVSFGDISTFDGATCATWATWFRPTGTNATQDIYCKNSGTVEQWCIRYNATTDNITVQIRNTGLGTTYSRATNDASYPDSTWSHIVVTWCGSGGSNAINIYRNGALNSMAAASGTNPASLGTSGTPAATIGADDGGGNAFTGHIDEAAGWAGTEATLTQVGEIYYSGAAANLSVLATMPAPNHWWRLNANDSHNGAGGVIDYGSSAANGTGQNLEAADIDSATHAP